MSFTMWRYYQERAADMAARSLTGIGGADHWRARRDGLHVQFMQSMGLHPLPERCDLCLTDYGEFRGTGYRARRVAWQLLPDCRGTGVIYHPEPASGGGRLPGVLYACGHAAHGVDNYQRHGMMWARRGYVCLVFDTIEQHDNTGEHHPAPDEYAAWLARGYSAAGGELWNTIRALDVLAGLPEVDAARLGVTGVSGGGSMSFYLAVADERVAATAPCGGVSVAKYALYKRHLMTHCGCFYYHNIFGRDVTEYAALIAPRPLLLCFPAHDKHFSPPEFHFLYDQARSVYRLLGVDENCGLCECDGPHGYGFKMECLTAINDWFDRHLAGAPRPAAGLPGKEQPEQVVSVFNGAPLAPDRLELLPELLAPERGTPALPATAAEWPALRDALLTRLRNEVFHLILNPTPRMELEELGDWRHADTWTRKRYLGRLDGMEIFMDLFLPHADAGELLVGVTDGDDISYDLFQRFEGLRGPDCAMVFIEPRGTGMSAPTPRQSGFLLRAGAMVGITPWMMRVQDLCAVLPFLRGMPCLAKRRLCLYGRGESAAAALYAALLTPGVDGLVLDQLPASHRTGAAAPGILRVLDINHALGLAAPRPVALVRPEHGRGTWAARAYERIGAASSWLAGPPSLKMAFDGVFQ